MQQASPSGEATSVPCQSEVLADAVVHAFGTVGSVFAVAALLALPAIWSDAAVFAATLVYGAGLLAMFWASAAYNLVVRPAWKARLRRLDHAAIFLMIAGTYTPFALLGLRGGVGWTLLAVVWSVAFAGMVVKLRWPDRLERLSLVLYLLLGWCGVAVLGRLLEALPTGIFLLLVAGGLVYSAGVIFFRWRQLSYNIAIWHAFVLAAAICHYAAIFQLIAGRLL